MKRNRTNHKRVLGMCRHCHGAVMVGTRPGRTKIVERFKGLDYHVWCSIKHYKAWLTNCIPLPARGLVVEAELVAVKK